MDWNFNTYLYWSYAIIIKMGEQKELEEKIEYWIKEVKYVYDKERKQRSTSTLKALSKQYKELTGEWYVTKKYRRDSPKA